MTEHPPLKGLIRLGKSGDPGANQPNWGPELPAKAQLQITDAAAGKILFIAEREGKDGHAMRVGILGGGCAGLSYTFSFVEQPEARDHVFEAHGARVCVDPKSLIYIGGSVLDWTESLMQSGFVFTNPQVASSCSCGSSFTVK